VIRDLVIIGVNHHTAPVELRERLAPSDGDLSVLAKRILELGPPVHEVVALATCNRVELVACCAGPTDVVPVLTRELFAASGLDPGRYTDNLFDLRGREAVRHVFRVASSLDSMVVGEPQILGQMKVQYAAAAASRSAGPILNRVFHKTFAVAKRVRTETAVASKAVSVASVASELAVRIFETLKGRVVMLLGVGEMGELAARHFVRAGAGQVMVANRTFESAVELARSFGGTPVPLDRMETYLPLADLVVGSAGGGELLSAARVDALMRERQSRPVFFIDLAVPRNFDPAINKINNAYIYDIDDLSGVAGENREEREKEAVKGEAIVEEEVDMFWRWFEKLDVVPTIVELRDYAETIRRDELERTLAKLDGLSEGDRERLDQMTRSMISKLLHHPTAELKGAASTDEESSLLTAIRQLFGLEKPH